MAFAWRRASVSLKVRYPVFPCAAYRLGYTSSSPSPLHGTFRLYSPISWDIYSRLERAFVAALSCRFKNLVQYSMGCRVCIPAGIYYIDTAYLFGHVAVAVAADVVAVERCMGTDYAFERRLHFLTGFVSASWSLRCWILHRDAWGW